MSTFDIQEIPIKQCSKKQIRRIGSDDGDLEVLNLTTESSKKNYMHVIIDSSTDAYCFEKDKYLNRMKVLKYLWHKIATTEFNPKKHKFNFNISLWNPDENTSIDTMNTSGKTEIRIDRKDNCQCKDKEFVEILRKILTSSPKPSSNRSSANSSPSPCLSITVPNVYSRPSSTSTNEMSPLKTIVDDLWKAFEEDDDAKFADIMEKSTPVPEPILVPEQEVVPINEQVLEEYQEEIFEEEEEEEIFQEQPAFVRVSKQTEKTESRKEEIKEIVIKSCSGNVFHCRDADGNEYEINKSHFEDFLKTVTESDLVTIFSKLKTEITALTELNDKLDSKLKFAESKVSKSTYLKSFCTEENRTNLASRILDMKRKVAKNPSLKERIEDAERKLEASSIENEKIHTENLEKFTAELNQAKRNHNFFYPTNVLKKNLLKAECDAICEMKDKITNWFSFSCSVIDALKTASEELNFKCFMRIITQGTSTQYSIIGIKPTDNLIQLVSILHELKFPSMSQTNLQSPTLSASPSIWRTRSPMEITQMVSKPGIPSQTLHTPTKKYSSPKPSKNLRRLSESNSDADSEYESEEFSNEEDDDYSSKHRGRRIRN